MVKEAQREKRENKVPKHVKKRKEKLAKMKKKWTVIRNLVGKKCDTLITVMKLQRELRMYNQLSPSLWLTEKMGQACTRTLYHGVLMTKKEGPTQNTLGHFTTTFTLPVSSCRLFCDFTTFCSHSQLFWQMIDRFWSVSFGKRVEHRAESGKKVFQSMIWLKRGFLRRRKQTVRKYVLQGINCSDDNFVLLSCGFLSRTPLKRAERPMLKSLSWEHCFRLSAAASRYGLMESCPCSWRGRPPPPKPGPLLPSDPPFTLEPPNPKSKVVAWPRRWYSALVSTFHLLVLFCLSVSFLLLFGKIFLPRAAESG